jgi:hypothetical protein
VNIADTIDGARRAFELAGRGCLVRLGEDEPRYATVAMGSTVARNRHGFE